MRRSFLGTTLGVLILLGATPVPVASAIPASPTISAAAPPSGLEAAAVEAGLRPEVLQLALRAYARAAAAHETTRSIVTIIDYSLASRERRLWVLDIDRGEVLAHELVAHGKATGGDIARNFSNEPGSYESSLGTFITAAGSYQGKHGLSLRLRGLDADLNSNAESRALVVHGAEYVNDGIVSQLGRLGRSEGCPALNPAVAARIIPLIEGETVVFSYYPTQALEQTLAS